MLIETYPNAFFVRLPRLLSLLTRVREVWVEVWSKEAGSAGPWFSIEREPKGAVLWLGRVQVAVESV